MNQMIDLAPVELILQTISMMIVAAVAAIGVRSYISSNIRAEEAKRNEQETEIWNLRHVMHSY